MHVGKRVGSWTLQVERLARPFLVLLMAVAWLSGCAAPPMPPNGDDNSSDMAVAREIEEADIVKLEDGYFYLANTFTGLRIIDARDMHELVMVGGLPLGGRGVELFVRDDVAFVFTAADFLRCAGEPVGFDVQQFADAFVPEYEGSRLWVVDVSDKSAPSLVTQFDFDGFVTATRRVGDVIYVAGNRQSDLGYGFGETGAFVESINVADPENITLVDTETFAGVSLDIHVTAEAMYVVGDDLSLSETTLVTYVDISDSAGEIEPRDQFRVPGKVENRFFVDEHEGTFRIVTEEWVSSVWTTVVALYVYDVADPDDVKRLARLPLVSDESLRAVRFDGARGYAVTFRVVDPLFVLDLSAPADPQISGELEVPGYSTHLVPLDDRLVGVGFDDTSGFRPAVALYDVSDPFNPRQLSRIILGERGSFSTSSEATVDEKALKVIEEAGLILLPFSTFDSVLAEWIDALLLIELQADGLRERSAIEHRGLVRRAGLLDTRVWVLSDVAVQSVDIDDLDRPVSLSTLNIMDEQELLDAGLRDCADSARFRGTDISPFFGWDCFGCGPFCMLTVLLTFAGLSVMRLVRHRP